MPPYVVKEVSTKGELDQIVEIVWKAQHEPYIPSAGLFFPILGVTEADRQAALKSSQERLWKKHLSNPDSHWIYAEDTETNKIVAGTQWEIHETNPFPSNTLHIPVDWWPEGEGRSFCESMLRQLYLPRFLWMKKPHTGLSMLVVHPRHRNRGLGSLLIAWGVDKADELNIEGFVECTDMARSLYERFGYRMLMKVAPYNPDPSSDLCKKLTHDIMPLPFNVLWRPVNNIDSKDGLGPNGSWEMVSQ